MKKTLKFIFIIGIIMLPLYFLGDSVFAKSITELEEELNELEKEQKELNSEKRNLSGEKKEIESEMDDNLNKQSSIQEQINELDSKISTANSDVKAKESELEETNNEINKLEENIKQLNEDADELRVQIKMRLALLKDRLKSIQESGGFVKYISVIFGSDSFSDLINRSTTVSTIMDSDKSLMKKLEQDQKVLIEKEKEVSKKTEEVKKQKEELEKQKKEHEAVKKELDSQKANQTALKEQLAEEFEELEEVKISKEEEEQLIASQAAVAEKAKKLLADKKARLEEEERKRLEEQKQQEESGQSPGGDNPNVGNGNSRFMWPVQGNFKSITSSYGYRIHPIYNTRRHHNGLDIAPIPKGANLPILAADEGIVASAGWLGGFGNVVMISHGDITTLYAHLSSISVGTGQYVERGSVIGRMGTTGDSTGVHLHFEVHPGGYQSTPSGGDGKSPSAVNPLNYLP